MAWCADIRSPSADKCKWCKCKACPVCSLSSSEPYATISVTDLDNHSEWMGYWMRFNLSSTEWRRFEAPILIPPSKRGHTLDVALILGHAAATYLIDDVTIVQKEAPASAAAITLDFEEDEHLAQETETSVAVRMPEGKKLIEADLASTAAAHSGKVGASVTVNEIITPAWHGRLELGSFSAAFNGLTITFWAKAHTDCTIHANVLDASKSYTWLAFW